MPVPKLFLFDVDQTLLSTMGGDRKALDMAFQELYRIAGGFDGIGFSGRMDLVIVGEAFGRWRIDQDHGPEAMVAFKEAYLAHLRTVLDGWDKGRVYPGVRALLRALAERVDVDLGLATGNFREAAFIKLKKYGLDHFFDEGGFGGDFEKRTQVVAEAIARCQARTGREYAGDDIYVIGDSPSDVTAGQANGVRSVAVATGSLSMEELKVYNPTYLFPDLSNTEEVLTRLLGPGPYKEG
ncbi:MAG: HAD family hydrolase [Dehalococcoidia bacterium]